MLAISQFHCFMHGTVVFMDAPRPAKKPQSAQSTPDEGNATPFYNAIATSAHSQLTLGDLYDRTGAPEIIRVRRAKTDESASEAPDVIVPLTTVHKSAARTTRQLMPIVEMAHQKAVLPKNFIIQYSSLLRSDTEEPSLITAESPRLHPAASRLELDIVNAWKNAATTARRKTDALLSAVHASGRSFVGHLSSLTISTRSGVSERLKIA